MDECWYACRRGSVLLTDDLELGELRDAPASEMDAEPEDTVHGDGTAHEPAFELFDC